MIDGTDLHATGQLYEPGTGPLRSLLLTKRQQAERRRLLEGRYFLVNMARGAIGEVFRCSRCNGKHPRLTLHCIEQPFSGISGGLFAYVSTVEQAEAVGLLSGPQRARLARIRAAIGRGAPDLAQGHPGLARLLVGPGGAPDDAVDLDIGMVSLGLLERIEPRDAQRLLDRINTRAALYRAEPLVVPGLITRTGG